MISIEIPFQPLLPCYSYFHPIYQLTSEASLPTESRWLPPHWNLLWVGLTSFQPKYCVKHGPGRQWPLLSRPHLLFLLPAETTHLQRGRCGLLCDSPSKSLQGRHARLRSGGPTPAIVHKKFGKPWACIILQIFQICHSKSSLSQPFSMTNLGNPDCFWSCPDFPILLWKIQPQPAIFRETLIVCDPVQSSQIVHGKSTLSQPFSITNLVVIGHTMIFQVRHSAEL